MVIISSKEGQLANRIWHASSFMVNAQEHGYRALHPFFDDYYSFFSESLKNSKNPVWFLGKRTNTLVTLFQKFFTLGIKTFLKLGITKLPFFEIVRFEGYEFNIEPFNLNDKKFVKKAKSKLTFARGWLFRDQENLKKHRQLLLDVWKPNKYYLANVEQYFKKYKNETQILIGVHLRGGDYKNFEGGKWYYTPKQYYEKIKEVAALGIFSNKKIAFVICTNEKNISFPDFENVSIFNEERHFIEDLYLLAKCDYIMGPPSTFSIWASFYGGKPLYKINELETKITDENFKANSQIF